MEIPKDPKYGKVSDLCATLGYPPQEASRGRDVNMLPADTPVRKSSILQHALLRHRNNPKTASLRLRQLQLGPGCSQTPEAIGYAAAFLSIPAHQRLFQWTVESEQRGWPVYPADSEKIRNSLAKLICQQEYWRRNNNYIAQRNIPHSDISDSSDESEAVDTGDSQGISGHGPLPSWRRSIKDQEAITKNIKIHLDFIYPPDKHVDNKCHDWLTKRTFNLNRTKDIDRFAIRSLHDLGLYMPDDTVKISQFVAASISYYNLEGANSPHLQLLWYSRCKGLVANFVGDFVGSWMEWEHGGYGFLEWRGPTICKSPEFEEAWKARRDSWQRRVPPSVASVIPDPPRLNAEGSNSPQINVNRKRAPRFVDLRSVSTSDLESENAKRQRTDNASAEDNFCSRQIAVSVRSDEATGNDVNDSLYQTSSYATGGIPISNIESSHPPIDRIKSEHVVSPQPRQDNRQNHSHCRLSSDHPDSPRTSELVQNTLVQNTSPNERTTSPANAHLPDLLAEAHINPQPVLDSTTNVQAPPRIASGSITNDSHTKASHPSCPPITVHPSARKLSTSTSLYVANTNLIKSSHTRPNSPANFSLGRKPSLYQLSGSFVGNVEYPHSLDIDPGCRELDRKVSSTLKDALTKPILQFAIENFNGMPDDSQENLVSSKVMSGLSLSDLFALMCDRSGKPQSDISQITFQCAWGNGATLVVSKYGGEESWTKAKKRMTKHFKNSQRQLPRTREFETWVYCGDTTQIQSGDNDSESS